MTNRSIKLLRAQAYASKLIHLLTKQSMDPHLYFERKYLAEINCAASAEAVVEILDGIALWLTSPDFGPDSLDRLEQELTSAGLPSIASFRSRCATGSGAWQEYLEQ